MAEEWTITGLVYMAASGKMPAAEAAKLAEMVASQRAVRLAREHAAGILSVERIRAEADHPEAQGAVRRPTIPPPSPPETPAPRDPARVLREAARDVLAAYDFCRSKGSFSGFWTHIDDLAKALDAYPIAAAPETPAPEGYAAIRVDSDVTKICGECGASCGPKVGYPHKPTCSQSSSPSPALRSEGTTGEAPLLCATDSGDEPVAYYAKDHGIDVEAFAHRVAVEIQALPEEPDMVREVRREWWRNVPCDCGAHVEHFQGCTPWVEGAYPVTVWHVEGDDWIAAPPESPASAPSRGSGDGGREVSARKPRFDPRTTLVAWWSPKEQDVEFCYPRRADGHLLHGFFSYARVGREGESLLKELEARGYDIATLRFSVRLKEKPREPHNTNVEACPHGCVGACTLCSAPPSPSTPNTKE